MIARKHNLLWPAVAEQYREVAAYALNTDPVLANA